jgi:hypothetical protein
LSLYKTLNEKNGTLTLSSLSDSVENPEKINTRILFLDIEWTDED